MTGPQTARSATDEPTLAARRVFARHQRRMYPDTGRCTFCGSPWMEAGTGGRLVDGCGARQIAATALLHAGQLTALGHPTPPAVLTLLVAPPATQS
jgi:hypothetical protein